MYDLIGDIHGHADELIQLLELLGYRKTQGVYEHSERKVIFLGDFIDRGPQILRYSTPCGQWSIAGVLWPLWEIMNSTLSHFIRNT